MVLLACGEGGEEIGLATGGGFGGDVIDVGDRIDGGSLQGGDEAGFGGQTVHEGRGANAADGVQGGDVEVGEVALGGGVLGGQEVERGALLNAAEEGVHDLGQQSGGLRWGAEAGEDGGEASGILTGAEELGEERTHQHGFVGFVLGSLFSVRCFPTCEGMGLEGGVELVEEAGEGGVGEDAGVFGGAELLEDGGGVGGGVAVRGQHGEAVGLRGAGGFELLQPVADLLHHAVELGVEGGLHPSHEALEQLREVAQEVLHPAEQSAGRIHGLGDLAGEAGILHQHAQKLVHQVPFLVGAQFRQLHLSGVGGLLVGGTVGGPDGLFQRVGELLPFAAQGLVAVFVRLFPGELKHLGVDVLLEARGAESVLRAVQVAELRRHGVEVDQAGDFAFDLQHGCHLAVKVTAGGPADGVGVVEQVVALERLLEGDEELSRPGFPCWILDAGENAELVGGVGAIFPQGGGRGGEGGVGAGFCRRGGRDAVGGVAFARGEGDAGLVFGAEVEMGGDLGAGGFPAEVFFHGGHEGLGRGGAGHFGDLTGGVLVGDFLGGEFGA